MSVGFITEAETHTQREKKRSERPEVERNSAFEASSIDKSLSLENLPSNRHRAVRHHAEGAAVWHSPPTRSLSSAQLLAVPTSHLGLVLIWGGEGGKASLQIRMIK